MEPAESPRHIAIIMDGNRRWAEKRGLRVAEGHKAGAKNVRTILEACKEFGVKYLTLYAFSTENWKRPPSEVASLMFLLRSFISENLPKMKEEGIRLRAIGDIEKLPLATKRILKSAINETSSNDGGHLILAISYGSRSEIVDAAKKLVNEVSKGLLKPGDIDENLFRSMMYAPDIPDPDIMIRTSGELRLSNFLLWQISYSELCFSEKCWPDFGRDDIAEALGSFKKRERRFGLRKC